MFRDSVFLTLVLVFLSTSVQADVGEAFGLGSRNAALGGATVGSAEGLEAFSGYTNPAALAAPTRTGKKMELSFGFISMTSNFVPIDGVVIENSINSDKTTGSFEKGNVDVDYLSAFGQVTGIAVRLLPDWMNLSAGLSIFTPFERASFTDTGEAFIPEYVLYRARVQRPQMDLGLGIRPTRNLHLGVGGHVAFSATTKVTSFMATSPNKSSTMRVSSSLKPKVSPYFGALFRKEDWALGSVVRLASTSEMKVITDTKGEFFSGAGSPNVNFSSQAAAFYDPFTIETGLSWNYINWATLFLEADYQAWSKYETPGLSVEGTDAGIQLTNSSNPSFEFRDIWIPRFGHEARLSESTHLRIGYAYRKGIIKTSKSPHGNYLDPSKHIVTTGLGFEFRRFFGLSVPTTLDFHAAYHHLLREEIKKEAADTIGAPGYIAGGRLYGGGLTLTLLL